MLPSSSVLRKNKERGKKERCKINDDHVSFVVVIPLLDFLVVLEDTNQE